MAALAPRLRPQCKGGRRLQHRLPAVQPLRAAIMEEAQAAVPSWLNDVNESYFATALGRPVYRCVITGTQELEQSEVATVTLTLPPNSTASTASANASNAAGSMQEVQVLLKRYHMPRLMARIDKPPEKWRISALSFANEFTFCHAIAGSAADQELLAAGVRIPKVYAALRHGTPRASTSTSTSDVPAATSSSTSTDISAAAPTTARPNAGAVIASTVGPSGAPSADDLLSWQVDFVLHFLPPSSFYQAGQLDLPQARAAVSLLAHFHALFWVPQPGRSDAHGELRPGLFRRGGWWRKQLRPSVKYHRIPAAFKALCEAFPDPNLMGKLDTADSHALMEKLAGSVDWINTTISNAPDLTLVHGDSKTSNLFFIKSATGEPEAWAIDFQWTGNAPSGLADVVYLLYGGVQYDVLQQHEAHLLRHYWEQLDAALYKADKGPYTWEQCQADAALELLAYYSTALPQLMDGLTPQLCQENWGKYAWLTHEMDPRVVALFCSAALQAARTVLP